MDQKSNSWHAWRDKGLGSSDAPVVMGVSPYRTPFQLWEEKTGRAKREPTNWIQQKGNDLEPMARAHVELMLDADFPATLFEHPQFPWLRASLDGWNNPKRTGLEIKYVGAQDYEDAKNGIVPVKYVPQIQHQYLCTSAVAWIYFAFNGKTGVIVDVKPDREYQLKLFDGLCKFWRCIQDDTPPPFVAKDYRCIRNVTVRHTLDQWADAPNDSKPVIYDMIVNDPVVKQWERWRCGKYRVNNGQISIVEEAKVEE